MSAVGSYILGSTQKGADSANVDINSVASLCLKALAARQLSFAELRSLTGFSEEALREGIQLLARGNLVKVSADKITLTPQGEKARFLVAS